MNGMWILENKSGQAIRAFRWESAELALVYLENTRRIQPVESTKDLDEDKVSYTLLANVNKKEVQQKPLALANGAKLKWVEEVKNIAPGYQVKESEDNISEVGKWTTGTHLVILLLAFVVSYFIRKEIVQPEEPKIVQIETIKLVPKVVAPMTKKQPKQIKIAKVAKPKPIKAPRVAQPKIAHNTVQPKQPVALNNMGALSVLGTMSKSKDNAGVELSNVKTSRGAGLGGGTAGSGGVQTSIYAKGIVAAPVGPGNNVSGEGGYGTRGKGGGKAGYGQMSLVGSSSSYFEPVEREATVEGGLDRDQIAEVIQRHIGQIRYCYEKGLQGKANLSGRVAIKFLIGSNGVVDTASVSNTSLRSEVVEGCIVSRLKTWQFPQPKGGVVVKVNYPFVLKRVSQG